MSSGPRHYREAERLVREAGASVREASMFATQDPAKFDQVMRVAESGIAAAQVLATLALAACQSTRITDHWVETDETDAHDWIDATAEEKT